MFPIACLLWTVGSIFTMEPHRWRVPTWYFRIFRFLGDRHYMHKTWHPLQDQVDTHTKSCYIVLVLFCWLFNCYHFFSFHTCTTPVKTALQSGHTILCRFLVVFEITWILIKKEMLWGMLWFCIRVGQWWMYQWVLLVQWRVGWTVW